MAFVPKVKSKKTGPALSSYSKPAGPPKPVAGPGATPKPGQLVREGINYRDLSPGLQAQMAKQAGLVPDTPTLPPGVVTPQQSAMAEEANEEAKEPKAEEAKETPAQESKEDATEEVPEGHTAVKAHVRKLPISKVGRAKLRARGVTPSDE
jgi:hypothetical protein